MIEKVIIKENSGLSRILNVKEIVFKRVTVLTGLNGHGKSSLLNGMIGYLGSDYALGGHKKSCAESIDIITTNDNIYKTFLGREDNGKYRGYFGDNMAMDIKSIFTSEGLSTINTFYAKLVSILQLAKENPTKDVVFFIDEADSGLSINNIVLLSRYIATIISDNANLQVIMTANNYEMISLFPKNILWVKSGAYIELNSYEEYKDYYTCNMLEDLRFKKNL